LGGYSVKKRAHVLVSGRVQGVFFRANTRYWALKHGVRGWVRNLPDGRVEAVFEGEEEDVKKVIELCRKGPPGAFVKRLDLHWSDYLGEFNDFEIRYSGSFF
jgi:acylphosphatase